MKTGSGSNVSSRVYSYAIKNDSWGENEVPDLNEARYDHSSCSLGDKIYVFGG